MPGDGPWRMLPNHGEQDHRVVPVHMPDNPNCECYDCGPPHDSEDASCPCRRCNFYDLMLEQDANGMDDGMGGEIFVPIRTAVEVVADEPPIDRRLDLLDYFSDAGRASVSAAASSLGLGIWKLGKGKWKRESGKM